MSAFPFTIDLYHSRLNKKRAIILNMNTVIVTTITFTKWNCTTYTLEPSEAEANHSFLHLRCLLNKPLICTACLVLIS